MAAPMRAYGHVAGLTSLVTGLAEFRFAFLKRDGSSGMQIIDKYEYKWERFVNVSIYVAYRQHSI